jgi:sugar phosphate isomerase/epimerase
MSLTRRVFLGVSAAGALTAAGQRQTIPIGLELYSVRSALAVDPIGTIKKVAALGYQVVEFFAPYYDWTTSQAKEMGKLVTDLGMRCHSTHNAMTSFQPANLNKTIDLNNALGTRFVVLASSIQSSNPADWKKLALETLVPAHEALRASGLRGGYHNHQFEFTLASAAPRPMEIIAAHTPKDFMLQLDVGTCVEAGSDPVAWIDANPGRIHSLHLKDWNKAQGYRVLFGDGAVPWKAVLTAAKKTGGAEYFLIEQEESDYSELEAVQRCFDTYQRKMVA